MNEWAFYSLSDCLAVKKWHHRLRSDWSKIVFMLLLQKDEKVRYWNERCQNRSSFYKMLLLKWTEPFLNCTNSFFCWGFCVFATLTFLQLGNWTRNTWSTQSLRWSVWSKTFISVRLNTKQNKPVMDAVNSSASFYFMGFFCHIKKVFIRLLTLPGQPPVWCLQMWNNKWWR